MKIRKLYKHAKLLVCAVAAAALGGCTNSFEDYNTNKNEATEGMMATDNLKTGAFFTQMQKSVVLFKSGIHVSSDYQIAQGLSSDLYSGYVAPTGTWYSGAHNGSYSFIQGWIRMSFEEPFTYSMSAWAEILKIAEEQNLPATGALATVLKVAAMHRVADTYGPIPYINFGEGTLQGEYDSLEDIYKKFFEELDGAIAVLTSFVHANPTTLLLEDFDLVYGGDVAKWVRFANTLRLRLAMRVSYVNETLAKNEAQKSIDNAVGFISAANERASLKHSSELIYYHPLYEIQDFNSGEARMSASMDAYMNGFADPRRPVYFKAAASDGQYHGVRLGIATSTWSGYVGSNISKLNMTEQTEIVWMTAAESYFLLAECALRWNIGGDARTLYEKGISISFEENGAGSSASYIASTATPKAFTDVVGSNSISSAPSDITVAWSDSASEEKKLERIITQKWIAMYPDGPEGWAEFRRTGYPKLLPVVTNNSNGTINTTIQVCRLPYPQSEYDKNAAGVQSGIKKLGGQDNGGTKLWWDIKD